LILSSARKRLLGFLVVALLFGFQCRVWAYSSFIGYGYTSCVVCHFNAFGNGPLTDYGRAVAAAALAGRPPFIGNTSDEDLGNDSGFLGSVGIPDYIRAQANYRGLLLSSNVQKGVQSRYINMQADLDLILKTPDNKIFGVMDIGYAPPPHALPTPEQKSISKVISREHYVAYQGGSFRVQAGFQDVVYGLRIPEHTAFSRTQTLLSQNDQSHGVALQYGKNKFEGGAEIFVGNLYQAADLRLRGASTMLEYDVREKARLGLSAYYGANAYRSRFMSAVHARVGAGEGSAILSELGFVFETAKNQDSTLGNYIFFQSSTRAWRGVHFLITGEYTTSETFKPRARTIRVGPGLMWLPFQRLELRFDLQTTRIIGGPVVTPDDLMLLSQVHLWF
jgi:hypothetical protein